MAITTKSKSVTTTAKGFGLSAFHPVTIIPVLVEGKQYLENRLGVQIHPSLHLFEENNCTIPVTVVNNSSTPRTIGKASKLGSCSNAFIEHTVISDTPFDSGCQQEEKYDEAKDVLKTYRNICCRKF